MKNKKLLFIGVLTAFLMLAVPFAMVLFDSDVSDAHSVQAEEEGGFWSAFENDTDGARITLQEDIVVNDTISLGNGKKTLDLDGHKITCNATTLFNINAAYTGGGLTILGEKQGSGISSVDQILFSATKDDHGRNVYASNFSLVVNGGAYTGKNPFFLYSGVYAEANVEGSNNVSAYFSNASIIGEVRTIWCGNGGVEYISIVDSKIEGGSIGLYLGSVRQAYLNNVDVVCENGTALEIKSGDVNIYGGCFSSGAYDISNIDIVNYNGSGSAESTICINNAYQNAAGIPITDVYISDSTRIINYSENPLSKPIVVYIDDKNSGKILYDVKLAWKNFERDVYCAKNINATGDYIPITSKVVDENTPIIDTESNKIVLDVENTITLDNVLSVQLGVRGEEPLYEIRLPNGTVISKGATISVETTGNGVYDIDFENIDTDGDVIEITLPFYGKSTDGAAVYYLNEITGEQTPMEVVGSTGSTVTFKTTHNSKYIVSVIDDSYDSPYVGFMESGVDKNVIYIAEIVLIVLALAGLVAVIRRN